MVPRWTRSVLAPLGVLLVSCCGVAGPDVPASRRDGPEGGQRRAGLETALAPGTFLVASRDLRDPNFFRTVVLLLHHDANGAFGVVVNRQTDKTASEAVPEIEGLRERDRPLYLGGPVAVDQIVVLARTRQRLENLQPVFEDICFTLDSGSLRKLVRRSRRTRDLRLFAGHAGWGPAQLDGEVARGGWHVIPADAATVFTERPEWVWHELIGLVDPPPELRVENGFGPARTTYSGETGVGPRAGG